MEPEINDVSPFDFIKDTQKYNALVKANESLNIHKGTHNTIVFIYTPPKVGSTSIVSSLRLFGSHLFDIIHIHNEEMLRVLAHIDGVTINELILFNKYLGKRVYVIDIYRSPIERKMSTYFEKIGTYHFNNNDKKVNQYNVNKITHRFNNIFSYLAIGDHFIDKYNIKIPEQFDWDKKYLLVEENGIKYIKLRLKDSNLWGSILTTIFGKKIFIVKDYETNNKLIKDLFQSFKTQYRIPINFLNEIMNCKYLNYYYSPEEKAEYYNDWFNKSSETKDGYTIEQYKLYEEITLENVYIDYVQLNHYMDEGCMCKACGLKRAEIASKVARGTYAGERIIHTQAKTELIHRRVGKINSINNAIQRINIMTSKNIRKDFNGEMNHIVNGKR